MKKRDCELPKIVNGNETVRISKDIHNENESFKNERYLQQSKETLLSIAGDMYFQYSLQSMEKLLTLKNEQLREICRELSLKVTGKKEELANRIYNFGQGTLETKETEGLRLSFSATPTIYGYQTMDDLISEKEVADYVIKMTYNYLPRAIVSSVARSNGYIAGKEACIQLVNSNFSEEIFYDISQGIAEEVTRLVYGGMICVKRGKICFYNGSFTRLYKAMYHVLSENKNPAVNRQRENLMVLVEKNGDEIKDNIVSWNEKNAVSTLARLADINDIINNESLKAFIRFMKRQDSVHFDRMFLVLCGKLQGMSFDEIGKKYGFSKRTAERTMIRIQLLYKLYDKDMVTLHHTPDNSEIGCTYRFSDTTASGSYQFRYGEGMNNSSVNQYTITPDAFEEYMSKNTYFFRSRSAMDKNPNETKQISKKYESETHVYHMKNGRTLIYKDGKCISE